MELKELINSKGKRTLAVVHSIFMVFFIYNLIKNKFSFYIQSTENNTIVIEPNILIYAILTLTPLLIILIYYIYKNWNN